jgi:hypothetical protein
MKVTDEQLCECIRYMMLTPTERVRLAKKAVGLPADKVPAWLNDDVMLHMELHGFTESIPIEGKDGMFVVKLTDKGVAFLKSRQQ